MKKTRSYKIRLISGDIIRHSILTFLAVVWLIPIIWMLATSFSAFEGRNILRFFPKEYSLSNYIRLFTDTDTVSNFVITSYSIHYTKLYDK